MTCLGALPSQLLTLLYMPHEILFLQHNVHQEYAKVAVGQDFIHTLPTLLVFAAIVIAFWKNPPPFNASKYPIYNKILQVCTSWLFTSAFIWLWLVSQQIVYCTMWVYWSQESEYRQMTVPWWQRVWYSYFPPPVIPPVLSSSFLSWIMCMLFASTSLACVFSGNQIKSKLCSTLSCAFENPFNMQYMYSISAFLVKVLIGEPEDLPEHADKSEWSSLSDFPSEVGNGDTLIDGASICPILNGTVRPRKYAKSSEFVKAYETFSARSSNGDASKHDRADEHSNGSSSTHLKSRCT